MLRLVLVGLGAAWGLSVIRAVPAAARPALPYVLTSVLVVLLLAYLAGRRSAMASAVAAASARAAAVSGATAGASATSAVHLTVLTATGEVVAGQLLGGRLPADASLVTPIGPGADRPAVEGSGWALPGTGDPLPVELAVGERPEGR